MTSGYYVIIQYCPDPGRDERVNVGVMTFVGGDVLVLIDNLAWRVLALFPEADHIRVRSAAYSVYKRLRAEWESGGMDAVKSFIDGKMCNDMRATGPRGFRADLNDVVTLFRDLVAPPKIKEPA